MSTSTDLEHALAIIGMSEPCKQDMIDELGDIQVLSMLSEEDLRSMVQFHGYPIRITSMLKHLRIWYLRFASANPGRIDDFQRLFTRQAWTGYLHSVVLSLIHI